MNRLLSPYIRHACRLALTLSSVLAFGLLFGGSPGLAAEGGGQPASEAPAVVSESVSNVTEHDATLEAVIDTDGQYTGYEFQIAMNAGYDLSGPACPFEFAGDGECAAIRLGEPLPAGLVEPQPQYMPAGSGVQSVRLDLASIGATLQPSTTYHYRVIASNGGSPTVDGPDQIFTTPGPQSSTGGEQSKDPGGPDTGQCPGGMASPPACTVNDPDPTNPQPKLLSRTQKLARALKACERRPKKHRTECRKRAEKKYAAVSKIGGRKR